MKTILEIKNICKTYQSKEGEILAFEGTDNLKIAEEIMCGEEIIVNVDLNSGDKSATAWGCDLTYDYVKINAEYTT